MRSVLSSADFPHFTEVYDYPDGFAVEGLQEKIYQSGYRQVSGKVHEIVLNGICIEHRHATVQSELELLVSHDFPFLKMHFELEGFSGYERKTKGSFDVDITGGTHRLFFFPEVKGRLFYPPAERFTLEIKLSLDFLNRLYNHNLESLGQFGKGIQQMQPVIMGGKSLPILPAMRQIIYDVIHCPYTGMVRKVYIEAKVMELFALQVQQFQDKPEEPAASSIRKDDVEKLYHVKELITQNLQEPCSLIQLAEMAGINDFKLKKGFKELFGNTVFGYMTDVRMEKAKELLLENKQTIADIAFDIGYKNPQHFTAAFKRKFGYLPSQLRR